MTDKLLCNFLDRQKVRQWIWFFDLPKGKTSKMESSGSWECFLKQLFINNNIFPDPWME